MPDPKEKQHISQTRIGVGDAGARVKAASDRPIDLMKLGSEPTQLAQKPLEEGRASSPQVVDKREEFIKGRLKKKNLTVLSNIGEGGMGKVYLCRDENLDRLVAVKLMLREYFTKDDLRERFIREALTLARMQHPNIITIHGKEEDSETGDIFIVMEYLKGINLADLLEKEGPLEWSKAQPILEEVCSALEAVHAEGIIHRDIKPENIFLTKTNGNYHVKVLDFGLARMEEDPLKKYKTQSGEIFGSPMYMAPEQAVGENEKVDARSDIYAVGAVLYEMLTGSAPFPLDPSLTRERNWMSLLPKITFEVPQLPRERAPKQKIPVPVQEIAMRCLEKDRDKRFQSMADLGEAISHARASLVDDPRSTPARGRDRFNGRIINDSYVIDEKIGQAGNGKVYVAHSKKAPAERYALKFLNSPLDDEMRTVQLRKAGILAKLNHPNVAKMVDIARSEDGVDYIVSDYMKGKSLSAVLKQGKLSLDQSAHIIEQICDGLQAAHEKGVIHNGLKPSNIFIEQENASDVVKIVDFGLVRKPEEIVKLGTPAYMAPELAISGKGFGNNVDNRADIYSVGVMLHEMVTGGLFPFEVTVESEIIRKNDDVVPPSQLGLEIAIPPALELVIMRCLAKDPLQRYNSMAELKEALIKAGVIRHGTAWVMPRVIVPKTSTPAPTAMAFGSGAEQTAVVPPLKAPENAPGWNHGDKTMITTRTEIAKSSRRKRLIGGIAAGMIGAGAIATLGVVALRSRDKPPAVIEPTPMIAVQQSAEKPPQPAKRVNVVIKTQPDGVEVLKDGAFLCSTSQDTQCTVTYSADSVPVSLSFSKKGFVPRTETVSPDSDTTLDIRMDPEPKLEPLKPNKKKPAAPPRDKPADTPFKIKSNLGK